MKVLIVDDDDDIRRIACLGLSRLGGMHVVEARGGLEGVKAAESEAPDVVLLDVMMPEVDGPSTLALLRAGAATARIPVVFLTAEVGAAEVEGLRALGAAGVIRKPFDPTALANQVLAALGGSK